MFNDVAFALAPQLSTASGDVFQDKWLEKEISFVIADTLQIARTQNLQNPKTILIPRIKQHIKEADAKRVGYDIDAIGEKRNEKGEVICFVVPVIRNNAPAYKMEYYLNREDIEDKSDRQHCETLSIGENKAVYLVVRRIDNALDTSEMLTDREMATKYPPPSPIARLSLTRKLLMKERIAELNKFMEDDLGLPRDKHVPAEELAEKMDKAAGLSDSAVGKQYPQIFAGEENGTYTLVLITEETRNDTIETITALSFSPTEGWVRHARAPVKLNLTLCQAYLAVKDGRVILEVVPKAFTEKSWYRIGPKILASIPHGTPKNIMLLDMHSRVITEGSGKGTTFNIKLPVAQSEAPAPPTARETEKIERASIMIRRWRHTASTFDNRMFSVLFMQIDTCYLCPKAAFLKEKINKIQQWLNKATEAFATTPAIERRMKQILLTPAEAEKYVNKFEECLSLLESAEVLAADCYNTFKTKYIREEAEKEYGAFERYLKTNADMVSSIRACLELAKATPSKETNPLNAIIDAVKQEGISFEIRCNTVLPVRGNFKNLVSGLNNIISNAKDFAKTSVKVIVEEKNGKVIISVVDDGPGLPERYDMATGLGGRQKVFDLNNSTKGTKGTGLGTTEAYYSVIDAGGTIDVTSEPGKGTTFTIRLPIAQPAAPAADASVLETAADHVRDWRAAILYRDAFHSFSNKLTVEPVYRKRVSEEIGKQGDAAAAADIIERLNLHSAAIMKDSQALRSRAMEMRSGMVSDVITTCKALKSHCDMLRTEIIPGLKKVLGGNTDAEKNIALLDGVYETISKATGAVIDKVENPLKSKTVDIRKAITDAVSANSSIRGRTDSLLSVHFTDDAMFSSYPSEMADLWPPMFNIMFNNSIVHGWQGEVSELKINIDGYKKGGELVMSIHDNGKGMTGKGLEIVDAATGKQRAFIREFTTSKLFQDSAHGEGLAIVWDIVRLHGGTIDVASEPGKGTTFTLRLPMVSEPGSGQAIRLPIAGTRDQGPGAMGKGQEVGPAQKDIPWAKNEKWREIIRRVHSLRRELLRILSVAYPLFGKIIGQRTEDWWNKEWPLTDDMMRAGLPPDIQVAVTSTKAASELYLSDDELPLGKNVMAAVREIGQAERPLRDFLKNPGTMPVPVQQELRKWAEEADAVWNEWKVLKAELPAREIKAIKRIPPPLRRWKALEEASPAEAIERAGIAIRSMRHTGLFDAPDCMSSAKSGIERIIRRLSEMFPDTGRGIGITPEGLLISDLRKIGPDLVRNTRQDIDGSIISILDNIGDLSKEGRLTTAAARECVDRLFWISQNVQFNRALLEIETRNLMPQIKMGSSENNEIRKIFEAVNGRLQKAEEILQSRVNIATGSNESYSPQTIMEIVNEVSSGERAVSVEGNIPATTEVRVDRLTLKSAIGNIVDNAVYFAGRKQAAAAEVRITLTEEAGFVKIDIADNGNGVDKELLEIDPVMKRPRLFNLNVSKREGGTGLGVTETWYAVKDMGGTIEVASEPGKGTTFTLRLPFQRTTNDERRTTNTTRRDFIKGAGEATGVAAILGFLRRAGAAEPKARVLDEKEKRIAELLKILTAVPEISQEAKKEVYKNLYEILTKWNDPLEMPKYKSSAEDIFKVFMEKAKSEKDLNYRAMIVDVLRWLLLNGFAEGIFPLFVSILNKEGISAEDGDGIRNAVLYAFEDYLAGTQVNHDLRNIAVREIWRAAGDSEKNGIVRANARRIIKRFNLPKAPPRRSSLDSAPVIAAAAAVIPAAMQWPQVYKQEPYGALNRKHGYESMGLRRELLPSDVERITEWAKANLSADESAQIKKLADGLGNKMFTHKIHDFIKDIETSLPQLGQQAKWREFKRSFINDYFTAGERGLKVSKVVYPIEDYQEAYGALNTAVNLSKPEIIAFALLVINSDFYGDTAKAIWSIQSAYNMFSKRGGCEEGGINDKMKEMAAGIMEEYDEKTNYRMGYTGKYMPDIALATVENLDFMSKKIGEIEALIEKEKFKNSAKTIRYDSDRNYYQVFTDCISESRRVIAAHRALMEHYLKYFAPSAPAPAANIAYWQAAEYMKMCGRSADEVTEDIKKIWCDSLGVDMSDEMTRRNIAKLTEDLKILVDSNRVFLAVDQSSKNTIVGFSAFKIEDEFSYMCFDMAYVAVLPNYREGHLGADLMDLCMSQCAGSELGAFVFHAANSGLKPFFTRYLQNRGLYDEGNWNGLKYTGNILEPIKAPPLQHAASAPAAASTANRGGIQSVNGIQDVKGIAGELKIILDARFSAKEAEELIGKYLDTYTYKSLPIVESLQGLLSYGLPEAISKFFSSRNVWDKTEQGYILEAVKTLYHAESAPQAVAAAGFAIGGASAAAGNTPGPETFSKFRFENMDEEEANSKDKIRGLMPIRDYHKVIVNALTRDRNFLGKTLEASGVTDAGLFTNFDSAVVRYLVEADDTRVYSITLFAGSRKAEFAVNIGQRSVETENRMRKEDPGNSFTYSNHKEFENLQEIYRVLPQNVPQPYAYAEVPLSAGQVFPLFSSKLILGYKAAYVFNIGGINQVVSEEGVPQPRQFAKDDLRLFLKEVLKMRILFFNATGKRFDLKMEKSDLMCRFQTTGPAADTAPISGKNAGSGTERYDPSHPVILTSCRVSGRVMKGFLVWAFFREMPLKDIEKDVFSCLPPEDVAGALLAALEEIYPGEGKARTVEWLKGYLKFEEYLGEGSKHFSPETVKFVRRFIAKIGDQPVSRPIPAAVVEAPTPANAMVRLSKILTNLENGKSPCDEDLEFMRPLFAARGYKCMDTFEAEESGLQIAPWDYRIIVAIKSLLKFMEFEAGGKQSDSHAAEDACMSAFLADAEIAHEYKHFANIVYVCKYLLSERPEKGSDAEELIRRYDAILNECKIPISILGDFSLQGKPSVSSAAVDMALKLAKDSMSAAEDTLKFLAERGDEGKYVNALKTSIDKERSLFAFLQKLSACMTSPSFAEYDLNALITETAGVLLKPEMENERLRFTLNLAADLPRLKSTPAIWFVWTNLFTNARDAIRDMNKEEKKRNGEVTVITGFDKEHGEIVIKVSDNGTGMDEATLAMVRSGGGKTTKGETGGGNGIPFIYSIIHSLGGTVNVESKPGEGTTFTLRLPVANEQASGQAIRLPAAEAAAPPAIPAQSKSDVGISGGAGTAEAKITHDDREAFTFLVKIIADCLHSQKEPDGAEIARKMQDKFGVDGLSLLLASGPLLKGCHIEEMNVFYGSNSMKILSLPRGDKGESYKFAISPNILPKYDFSISAGDEMSVYVVTGNIRIGEDVRLADLKHDDSIWCRSSKFNKTLGTVFGKVLDGYEASGQKMYIFSKNENLSGEGPYWPSYRCHYTAAFEYIGANSDDHLLDVGSGDGSVVLSATSVFGMRATGIEAVPSYVEFSNKLRDEMEANEDILPGLADFICGKFQVDSVDFSKYSIIYYFSLGTIRRKELLAKLLTVKEGCRIIITGQYEPDIEGELARNPAFKTVGLMEDILIYPTIRIYTRLSGVTAPAPASSAIGGASAAGHAGSVNTIEHLTGNNFVRSLFLEGYAYSSFNNEAFREQYERYVDAARKFLTQDHSLKKSVFSRVNSLQDEEILKLSDKYLATRPSWKDGVVGFYEQSTYDISEGALPLRLAYLQGIIKPANASEILFPKTFELFASGESLEKLVSQSRKNAEGFVECYYAMYLGTAILARQFEKGSLVLIQKKDMDSLCRLLEREFAGSGSVYGPQKIANIIMWRLLCVARLCAPLDKPNKIETLDNIAELINRLKAKYPAVERLCEYLYDREARPEAGEAVFVSKVREVVPAGVLDYLRQRIAPSPASAAAGKGTGTEAGSRRTHPTAKDTPPSNEWIDNLTLFFRHNNKSRDHEDKILYDRFVDTMAAMAKSGKALRILSAGCSTGEEAYTIAMELLEKGAPRDKIRIVGVDDNEICIKIARNANYEKEDVDKEVPPEIVAKYFIDNGDSTYTIRQELRDIVEFRRADLAKKSEISTLGKFSGILIINILYQLPPEKEQAARDNALIALEPDGMALFPHNIVTQTHPAPAAAQPEAIVHDSKKHDEFYFWLEKMIADGKIKKGLPLYLFDYHSDAASEEHIWEGSWAYHVLKKGYVSKIVWVLPAWVREMNPPLKHNPATAQEYLRAEGLDYSYCYADNITAIQDEALATFDFDFFSLNNIGLNAPGHRATDEEIRKVALDIFGRFIANGTRLVAVDMTESGARYTFEDQIPQIHSALAAGISAYRTASAPAATGTATGEVKPVVEKYEVLDSVTISKQDLAFADEIGNHPDAAKRMNAALDLISFLSGKSESISFGQRLKDFMVPWDFNDRCSLASFITKELVKNLMDNVYRKNPEWEMNMRFEKIKRRDGVIGVKISAMDNGAGMPLPETLETTSNIREADNNRVRGVFLAALKDMAMDYKDIILQAESSGKGVQYYSDTAGGHRDLYDCAPGQTVVSVTIFAPQAAGKADLKTFFKQHSREIIGELRERKVDTLSGMLSKALLDGTLDVKATDYGAAIAMLLPNFPLRKDEREWLAGEGPYKFICRVLSIYDICSKLDKEVPLAQRDEIARVLLPPLCAVSYEDTDESYGKLMDEAIKILAAKNIKFKLDNLTMPSAEEFAAFVESQGWYEPKKGFICHHVISAFHHSRGLLENLIAESQHLQFAPAAAQITPESEREHAVNFCDAVKYVEAQLAKNKGAAQDVKITRAFNEFKSVCLAEVQKMRDCLGVEDMAGIRQSLDRVYEAYEQINVDSELVVVSEAIGDGLMSSVGVIINETAREKDTDTNTAISGALDRISFKLGELDKLNSAGMMSRYSEAKTKGNNLDASLVLNAPQQTQPLIIALGTSWIKGYERQEDKRSFKYKQGPDLNELITSIRGYCSDKNITFIDDDDSNLLGRIGEEKQRAGKSGAKVIVLAGQGTVKSNAFESLRSDKDNLVVGVDSQNLAEDSYIRLMEMLTIALKLSINLEVAQDSTPIKITKDTEHNIYIFLPPAEPADYDTLLKPIYAAQRSA